jgi:hypothetical protein
MEPRTELAALYTEAEELLLKKQQDENRDDIQPQRIHVHFEVKRNLISGSTDDEVAARIVSVRQYVSAIKSGQIGFTDGKVPAAADAPEQQISGVVPLPRDLTEKLKEMLNRPDSPLRTIWQMINDPNVDWSRDDQSWQKGYVMACFSELVYLRMSKYEVPGRDRYKVIPNSALKFLLEHNIQIDLDRLLPGAADIASATGDSGQIVFGVFVFPRFTIVAIRGTMQWLGDWLTDLDERRIQVGDYMYHYGFYSEANGALKDVAAAVPRDRPIYFTGHSLGGALASLLPRFWPDKQRLMTPYTFASPRIGNDKLAEVAKSYGYVRAGDPIPHLPPRSSGFCNSGWPLTVIPSGDVWLSGWEIGKRLFKAAAAHKMEQYRKLMGEECGATYCPADVYFNKLQQLLVDTQ